MGITDQRPANNYLELLSLFSKNFLHLFIWWETRGPDPVDTPLNLSLSEVERAIYLTYRICPKKLTEKQKFWT